MKTTQTLHSIITKIFFLAMVFTAVSIQADTIQWKNTVPPLKQDILKFSEVLDTQKGNHVIVQFKEIPNSARQKELENSGVVLQRYLGSKAYFAKISNNEIKLTTIKNNDLENVMIIDPAWKIHPDLFNQDYPDYSITNLSEVAELNNGEDVEILALYIIFHPDVNLEQEGVNTIVKYGGTVRDYLRSINGAVIWLPVDSLWNLLLEDSVEWIEPPLPPFEENNDSNRVVTQVNDVQAAPYNLNGSGVTVLVYDGGYAYASHNDFGGRLTVRDSSGLSTHATHVSGTVGGSGVSSSGTYKGMAPSVTIQSYGFEYDGSGYFLYTNPGDLEANYDQAINTYGAVISNNSIGTNLASNGFPCEYEGDYGATSMLIDEIVRGSLGEPMRIIWANGNERGNGRCGTLYNTTAPPACAKNHITVGALNSDDDSITDFSSWGPADDGRIKPDISAPGCQLGGDAGVTSCSSSTSSYTTYCGTSMAAPTVTGIGALIIQEWKSLFPSAPLLLNSTLKILLAHNAQDRGNTGPDCQFGYGSVRVKNTIDFLRRESFVEESISQGELKYYFVDVASGTAFLKATIAWDDPAGALNTIPELVNDIDITATAPDGTTIHFPWTIDPSNPANPAVQNKADHLNNIEQVYVANPTEGIWTITVKGYAVASGPQTFSLAVSPDFRTCDSEGTINLDAPYYSYESDISITVIDCDLDTPGVVDTTDILIESDTETAGETVVLVETSSDSAVFQGTISCAATNANGVLWVSDGDTVTATYSDADDGSGSPASPQSFASIDCAEPISSNVQITDISKTNSTITFDTNEPTTAIVRCGVNPEEPFTIIEEDNTLGTSHTVELDGLELGTTYYFEIEVFDIAGNSSVNNNEGEYFSFTTTSNWRPPFSDNFETGNLEDKWVINAGGSGTTPLVQLDSTMVSGSPHSGSRVVLLGDSTSGTYAIATLDLVMDLRNYSDVELSFWWITANLESDHYIRLDIWDGSWHNNVNSWGGYPTVWTNHTLDLTSYNLINGFTIRFQSYMDYYESSDASYLDDVQITGTLKILDLIIPNEADEDDGVLMDGGRVEIPQPISNDINIDLISSDTSEIDVPTSATILAGNLYADFPITVVDDNDYDGSKDVIITASSSDFTPNEKTITVHDNEINTISLNIPDSATEGDGILVNGGIISVTNAVSGDIEFNLISDDTSEIITDSVIIADGQTTAPFNITIVDDDEIDNTQTAVGITASHGDWVAGSDYIDVNDNENYDLTLNVSSYVFEGDGEVSGLCSVSISGRYNEDVIVSLNSDDTNKITVPLSVTIPAGETEADFEITVNDDCEVDGASSVNISADSSSFTTDLKSIEVRDNEADHLVINTIVPDLTAGENFAFSITVENADNQRIENFEEMVSLYVEGDNTIQFTEPADIIMSAGQWVGNLKLYTADTNAIIIPMTEDLCGTPLYDLTNFFNISHNVFDSLAISEITSPKFADYPFDLSVTAQDAYGNIIDDYNENVNITGLIGNIDPEPVEILTFTRYADISSSGEYQHTLTAISTYFTDYNETSTTTENPATLASELVGKDVFLIVEQESASSSNMSGLGTSWASVLTDFVNNGGIIILCSHARYEYYIYSYSGLMTYSSTSSSSSTTLTKALDHNLTEGVASSFTGSYICLLSGSNGTGVVQSSSSSTYKAVMYRDLGLGHVVYIGSDYFTLGTDMDKVMANAVKWAQSDKTSVEAGTIIPISEDIITFVNGKWEGQMTVQEPAENMHLFFNDDNDYSIYSNTFSVKPWINLTLTLPENASEGDGELINEGEILLDNPAPFDMTIEFESEDISEVIVPASATILQGESSASFTLSIVDDTVYDSSQIVTINPTSLIPLTINNDSMKILDNDINPISISAIEEAVESSGLIENAGVVSVRYPVAGDVAVYLSSNDLSELTLPPSTIIENGETTASFDITFVDDSDIDTDQIVTLTAFNDTWTTGSTTTSVIDDENTTLTLNIISSAFEGEGIKQDAGNISISGTLDYDLVVNLSLNDATEISVPAEVTISAGNTSSSFDITVLNDVEFDGTQRVLITISADGFISNSQEIAINDNEVDHFSWELINEIQTAGTIFPVTFHAENIENQFVNDYNGIVEFTAQGDHGSQSVAPASINLISGAWTGNVKLCETDTNISIYPYCDSYMGIVSGDSSNTFDVINSELNHFEISNIASPKYRNYPFDVSITVKDAYGNIVPDLNDTADICGVVGWGIPSSIVITEIDLGTVDALEFTNVSDENINISDWKISIYDDLSWPNPAYSFDIPTTTTCLANDIITISEYGTAPGNYPSYYTGTNLFWAGSSTGAAVLIQNENGDIIDFAATGMSSAIENPIEIPNEFWSGNGILLGGTGTVQRNGNTDNNNNSDWAYNTGSIGYFNSGLTAPFIGGAYPISISPQIINFSNGIWNGEITVEENVDNMYIKLDYQSTIVEESNTFDVDTVPSYNLNVISDFGNPTPAAGVHAFNKWDNIDASVEDIVYEGEGCRHVCDGYTLETDSSSTQSTLNNLSFVIDEDTTLSWHWTTQYYINILEDPDEGGDVTPQSDWYEEAASINLNAAIDPHYIFTGWSGSIDAIDNPLSIDVLTSMTIVANFKHQGKLVVISENGNPSPSIGTSYYDKGTTISANVESLIPGAEGERNVCTGYILETESETISDSSNEISFVVDQDTTLTWTWEKQYYLTVNSQYGDPFGEDWYKEGDYAIWYVDSPIYIDEGHRTLTDNTFGFIQMNQAETININDWTTQYYLTIESLPQEYGSVSPSSNWYDENLQLELIAQPNDHYEFIQWEDAITTTTNPLTIDVSSSQTYTAEFAPQKILTITSEYGNPTPEGTCYCNGSTEVTARVENEIEESTGIKRVCVGWDLLTGTQVISGNTNEATFIMDNDKTLTWKWKTQYFLTTTCTPAQGGSIEPSSNWFDEEETVNIIAAPNEGWYFLKYEGDLTGAMFEQEVIMDSPKEIIGVFIEPSSIDEWMLY